MYIHSLSCTLHSSFSDVPDLSFPGRRKQVLQRLLRRISLSFLSGVPDSSFPGALGCTVARLLCFLVLRQLCLRLEHPLQQAVLVGFLRIHSALQFHQFRIITRKRRV